MVDEARDKRPDGRPAPPDPLGGLTDPRLVSLERVHIRTREAMSTRSAWRLIAATGEGDGTISLIEISPTVSLFRGEGIFLGWSSDRLQSAYRILLPPDTGPDMEFNQLG